MAEITIYTDGSANNATHAKGGYGIVIINETVRQFCGGSYINTSSARMEVLAIVRALKKCKVGDIVTIYSDNEYAVNTLEKGWIFKWEKDNFRGRKNRDLWRDFLIEYERLYKMVHLKWIRGHAGYEYNELADKLARMGANREKIIDDSV